MNNEQTALYNSLVGFLISTHISKINLRVDVGNGDKEFKQPVYDVDVRLHESISRSS